MSDSKHARRPFLLMIFIYLWRGISWLRITVFNLLFILLLIIVIAALLPNKDNQLPAKAPLLLAPAGVLVDQYTYASPQQQLMASGSDDDAETRVRDVVQLVDSARDDDRITGIILQLDHLQGGGLSKMREIGDALTHFQGSGKPVIAVADNYTQQQYFLASYADEIYLHDLGAVALTGFSVYRNYFKQALDKLSVKFHVFKVGDFKDYVEPYIRNDMSAPSREHNQQWLDSLWATYTEQIETHRELEPGTVTQFINTMADQLASTQGNTAQLALDMHLVDHIGSRGQRNQDLIERFGHNKDDAEMPLFVSSDLYQQHALPHDPFKKANIALIVASGTILDGHQPEGTIGGDTLTEIIRKARNNDAIKALVLRIDSGGGSAFASEIIRQELQATRDAGIPVVVSMGSVAASGGYWIAMAADQVWATPTTITGSIGVFGVFPTIEKTLSDLGVHSDGIGTTELAGAIRIDRPLSNDAANILQQGVEHIYDRFLQIVADSRHSTPQDIHQIAQGRVWTGSKAKELGLIDELGGLDDAIKAAAHLAQLDHYETRLFERDLTPQEQLIRQLLGQAQIGHVLQGVVSDWTGMDLAVLKSISQIIGQQKQLTTLDAPRASYALCLTCTAL